MCCCTALPQSILSSCINVLCGLEVANNLRPDNGLPAGRNCLQLSVSKAGRASAQALLLCAAGCPLNKINLQRSRLLLLLVFNAARSACALVFTPCRLFTRSQAWLGTYGVKPRPCCVPRSGTPGAAAPGRRCRRTALARARGAGVSQHGPERCRA